MAYLLDTNVAIHLRDHDPEINAKVSALAPPLLLSVVSRVELDGGLHSDPTQRDLRKERLEVVLRTVRVLPFGVAEADAYRTILERLGYSRRKVIDRMIAAQALVHRATLVTCNSDDFREIPGLDLLEW